MKETTSQSDASATDVTTPVVSEPLYRRVQQFLYREARLQDTHAYDEWEALWTDDGVYWVPANGSDTDPENEMSIIFDNRSRIRLRVEQLKTGRRHSQSPPSVLARTISNIEVTNVDGKELTVLANAMIYEDNLRGETIWGARNKYVLRVEGDDFKLVRKKVTLVNSHKPIFTLSFLV